MSRMPRSYLPPFGTPLYWRDEQSGVLGAAMNAYLAHRVESAPEPTSEQVQLLASYFSYVIQAPCWELGAERGALIKKAAAIKTADDIAAWIHEALDVGIDPI
jgi:hypothetical protein